MKPLNEKEKLYWNAYLKTDPPGRPLVPRITASYAGNRRTTDSLLQLYLSGKKIAGSSLVQDFISSGESLPQVGDFWILLDSNSMPRCILKTERSEMHKFKDVTVEIAVAEGEGDLSIDFWKKTHKKFYDPFLKTWGVTDIEDAAVVTEFFKLVHR